MKQIRISSDALADLNEGYVFYERQEAGLGDYFASSLKADIEALKVKGGSDPVVFQDFHRSLARTFPYGLFYTVKDEACIIWAVIDLRRDPMFIKRHLSETGEQ